MFDKDCLFCKFCQKALALENILYEDQDIIAFLDIRPRSPGHTLVVPKYHATVLAELPDSHLGPLLKTARDLGKKMKLALDAQGFSIAINDGEAAGQEVPHLHLHIMPRYAGDGGHPCQVLVSKESREPLSAIAKKILKSYFKN